MGGAERLRRVAVPPFRTAILRRTHLLADERNHAVSRNAQLCRHVPGTGAAAAGIKVARGEEQVPDPSDRGLVVDQARAMRSLISFTKTVNSASFELPRAASLNVEKGTLSRTRIFGDPDA